MLYERYAKRRFQEGKQEGKQEGIHLGVVERDKEWVSWMQRREEALASGEPFDEPSPAEKPSKTDNSPPCGEGSRNALRKIRQEAVSEGLPGRLALP